MICTQVIEVARSGNMEEWFDLRDDRGAAVHGNNNQPSRYSIIHVFPVAYDPSKIHVVIYIYIYIYTYIHTFMKTGKDIWH
jgi:hypothetical protein